MRAAIASSGARQNFTNAGQFLAGLLAGGAVRKTEHHGDDCSVRISTGRCRARCDVVGDVVRTVVQFTVWSACIVGTWSPSARDAALDMDLQCDVETHTRPKPNSR